MMSVSVAGIPKNRRRTTVTEPMLETLAELPFIGDQVVCLSHDQAARSGPATPFTPYWMPALAEEIAQATGFVLLVGPNGLGPWQTSEYYEAYNRHVKERDFPIILILLEGQPAP